MLEDLFADVVDGLGMPRLPRVYAPVAQVNPRIWELFTKKDFLTDEEWAELELYENLQQEEY